MDGNITTDAHLDTFNFQLALKSIYDELVTRDFSAMKFLCTDFIPLQKMEKVKTALDLFTELKTRRKIFPPDNVRLVAELLYCLRQLQLLKLLPYSCRDVGQSVEGGTSQLHPCRILLHRICEDITDDNFKMLRYLCTDIPKSLMEKICSPHDLILALEKRGSIDVASGDLSYLRRILDETNLLELVHRIDHFCSGFKGNENMDPSGDLFAGAVPKVLSTGYNFPDMSEGQETIGAVIAGSKPCQGSVTTVHTRQDGNDLPSYSMTQHPRGICLIFNNRSFYKDENDPNCQQQKVRNGSEIDCDLLEKVFGTKLDFTVQVYNDHSDTEICDVLAVTANEDHSNFDCFVCCVLSHGIDGAIYGANGKLVKIRQITSYFRPSRCRSLYGKPKLFFTQACQGKEKQCASDIVTDGPTVAEGGAVGGGCVTPKAETIPDEADFLVALSTVPGYVSYRSQSKGTWYITTLVKLLDALADHHDLLSILTRVNEEMSRADDMLLGGVVCKQVAMPMTTLRKQVRFN